MNRRARDRMAAARSVAWCCGLMVLLAGAAGIGYVLAANGPGDSGPIVGPGAAEKVKVGVELGSLVILTAVAVTWFGLWVASRSGARRGR